MMSMLPLATHIPAFVLMSSSIRKLCEEHGMIGWADPSSLMALSCVAMNAFILYVQQPLFTPSFSRKLTNG